MIIAGNRYEFIDEWWCVNGIIVGSEEWQQKKWDKRPTLIEALPQYYNVWRMEVKLNMELRLKPILAKRVKDIEQATIVQEVPPVQATSEPSQAINILPATPAPELKFIIAPKALPKPTWKIFDKPPKKVVAISKGDHQMVTSKGGQVYRRTPGWLKGCAGRFQDMQPAGLLGIGDVLAIGLKGVG